MTEKELNRKWLKEQLKDFTYSEEFFNKILELISESYINGLKQSRFDKRMLEYEKSVLMENLIRSKTKYNNDKARYRRKAKMYRDRINKAVEYIEDKLKIYPEGLVGKHLGQEFLKDILDLLKGDKE